MACCSNAWPLKYRVRTKAKSSCASSQVKRKKACWGCKPKPPKIPSSQIQPRHDCIQVYNRSAAAERVVSVHMEVAPRRRRDFFEQGQDFRIRSRFKFGEHARQNGRVVVNNYVRQQPRALVADLYFDVSPAGEFLLAT